jgi:hypothetical protein
MALGHTCFVPLESRWVSVPSHARVGTSLFSVILLLQNMKLMGWLPGIADHSTSYSHVAFCFMSVLYYKYIIIKVKLMTTVHMIMNYELLSLLSYTGTITTLQSSVGKYKWKILLYIGLKREPVTLNMIFLISAKLSRIIFMELCVPCIWKISSILICYGFSLCLKHCQDKLGHWFLKDHSESSQYHLLHGAA